MSAEGRAIPTVTLNDGKEMPLIGLGTSKLLDDEAVRVVRTAIDLGYRHFDTASRYGNEGALGRAFAEAIAAGDVTREELFITSKAWHDEQGAEQVQEAFHGSLRRLGLEFLDMYMIHWPWPQAGRYNETFGAMAQLQGLGLIQCLGVANFPAETLAELIAATGITPVVNQVEAHVGFTQSELAAEHERLGVVTEAWYPLAKGRVLTDPDVKAIGAAVGASPAQVALRYLLQLGYSIIPKSASAERLGENLGVLDFRLKRDHMETIARLDATGTYGRMGQDPEEFPG